MAGCFFLLLLFLLFFFPNKKTLIFSCCVVSEALNLHIQLANSPTYTHVLACTHSSCQSRVQSPHGLLLVTPSGYLPLCTVSYSINTTAQWPWHNLSHVYTHTSTHKQTWGQCTSVGSPMAKGCKALILKEKPNKEKKRTVHIERGDYFFSFVFCFICVRNQGESREIELDLRIIL